MYPLPLGIRLNNPGNLSFLDQDGKEIPWVGLVGFGVDAAGKKVAEFGTAEEGIRAMVENFKAYGLNSLGDIAAQWVGNPQETQDYLNNVEEGSGGMSLTAALTFDAPTCMAICKGICFAENGPGDLAGGAWYSDAVWLFGISQAGVK